MNDSAAQKPKARVENHLKAMGPVKMKAVTVTANPRFAADLVGRK